MKKLPIIALIGQTNAGKSSLLNRLAHKNLAIVAREEGTTRDSVFATIENKYLFIDTAGLKDPSDDFEATIQDQIDDAVNTADLIAIVVDSSKYPDQKDLKIARTALKSGKPVILLLNKSDLGESLDDYEFLSFGIKPENTLRISATTGQGIKEILPLIARNLSENPNKSEQTRTGFTHPDLKIALIGRPNVGKSSLFNSLAKKQQAIVSSRQGTTRDINRVQIKYEGKVLEILDTAGLRRPGKREVGIEKFSAIRSLAAIEEADICALLIDATEPHSKLDQSLAGQIVNAGKGIVLVVTKSDLIDNQKIEHPTKNDVAFESEFLGSSAARSTQHKDDIVSESSEGVTPREGLPRKNDGFEGVFSREERGGRTPSMIRQDNSIDEILDDLERDFKFLPFAPVLVTSSETGKNVTKLFELALEIQKSRKTEIKTSDLNKILSDAILSHPPAGLKNTRPKPKYLVQTDTCPPWFVLHGHGLSTLHWSWKRFLERRIREFYPFIGTPIMISYHDDKK